MIRCGVEKLGVIQFEFVVLPADKKVGASKRIIYTPLQY
jgi:hypothetical protein